MSWDLCCPIPAHSWGDAGASAVPAAHRVPITGGSSTAVPAPLQHPARSDVSLQHDSSLARVITAVCATEPLPRYRLLKPDAPSLGNPGTMGRGWRWGSQNSYFALQLCAVGTVTLLSPLHKAQLPWRIATLLARSWSSKLLGSSLGLAAALRCRQTRGWVPEQHPRALVV